MSPLVEDFASSRRELQMVETRIECQIIPLSL